MRRWLAHIIIFVVFAVGVQPALAQQAIVGADFATFFDNTEYAGMRYVPRSETLFSSRITPKVGIAWGERHGVMFGVDLQKEFGDDSKVLSEVNVQMFYSYDAPRVKLFAGIFPRSAMRGLGSSLFFDRDYRYYNNLIQGFVARYEDANDSYVELSMDYDGMRSLERRESFMIMSSGRKYIAGRNGLGDLHLGYDFLMGHYAKDYDPATADGVVDNLMFTPHIGYTHAFDMGGGRQPIYLLAELKYIVSLQRDRLHENVWNAPQGVEILVEAMWYGALLRNRLYLGDNLLSHYGRYGAALYHGSPLYSTEKGLFNAIEVGYKRTFCEGILDLEACLSVDYDGTGWGTRQYIMLGVNFSHGFELGRINN